MLTLKNSRTSIVSLKVILIIMMVYSRQLGKLLMIKKLQKLQLKKNATKEILMNYQENFWLKTGQELNMLNIGKHTVMDQN